MSVLVLDLAASAYEEDGKAHDVKLARAGSEGKTFGREIPHRGIWLGVGLQSKRKCEFKELRAFGPVWQGSVRN